MSEAPTVYVVTAGDYDREVVAAFAGREAAQKFATAYCKTAVVESTRLRSSSQQNFSVRCPRPSSFTFAVRW